MPCITIQFDLAHGPVISLGVAQPATLGTPAISGSAPRPTIHLCRALVDTGASITCVSPTVAAAAGLPLVGKAPMASASHVVAANTYLADLALPFGDPAAGAPSYVSQSVMLMEFQPNNPNYQALLGRDVICQGLFSITGYDRRFTICM